MELDAPDRGASAGAGAGADADAAVEGAPPARRARRVAAHPVVPSTLPRIRRPSGEKASLPREAPRLDLVVATVAVAAFALWLLCAWQQRDGDGLATLDLRLADAAVRLRSHDLVVDVARFFSGVERNGVADVLTVAVVAGLVWFRRFRRLAVFGVTLLVVQLVITRLQHVMGDPRPFGVERLGHWEGYGNPSLPVGHTAILLLGVVYGFVPDGRRRRVALVGSLVLVAMVAASGVVLGVEYPSWTLAGFGLAYLLGIAGYRLGCPDSAFSVRYRSGRSAHLELDDARLADIEEVLAQQMGLRVLDVEPFGMGESGGSTPMRILVDSERPIWLFAKLYAEQHLRADRLYKAVRALLYGRLEDERGFASVRNLVQNEDYYLRVFRDVGAPVIDAYGFVELRPEREYLLVMEFAEDAVELGRLEPPFSDDLIDQGLAVIRLLWDNGIAHRDMKPANLLVQDGELRVVDCGFAELRPSPWRQAVDLANMMLCLALGRDAATVYERASRLFSPDDIAESFAATRGVTIPSQLRSLLDDDGRDLVAQFRALAPRRAPVPIQHWSSRRVAAIAGTALLGVAVLWSALTVFVWHDRSRVDAPACPNSGPLLLVAQSVPSAEAVPCVAVEPDGWTLAANHVDQSGTRLTFAGPAERVDVTFARCGADADAPPSDSSALGRGSEEPELDADADADAGADRRFTQRMGNACLRAVVAGGKPADDAETVATVASSMRWIDRRRLDSTVAALTDGHADAV